MCCAYIYQVGRDYVGELDMAKDEGVPASLEAAAAIESRAENFMKRHCGEANAQANWRPKKRHRKSTWLLECDFDNQIRQVVPEGLAYFAVPKNVRDRGPAIKWPRLSWSADMASSNVTMACHLLYHCGLNIDYCPDFSHGVHDDIYNGLKCSGLYQHCVLALVRLNIPNSPWGMSMRYHQCKEALGELSRNSSWDRCFLFKEFAPAMLCEASTMHFADCDRPEEELFAHVVSGGAFQTKGAKTMMGRFAGVIRKIEEELEHISQRKFMYLHVALELDMLGSKKFASLARLSTELATTTTSIIETPQEAALRKSCANQLVVGLMDLLQCDSERKDRIVVAVSKDMMMMKMMMKMMMTMMMMR